MSGDVHVRFCESVGVRFPGATHLVLLCQHEAEARAALEQVQAWTAAAGLRLHSTKTRIVDATQPSGFDFLGYHFERGYRWPRAKSLKKLKETIRAQTRRTQGQSLSAIVTNLNRTLRGWLGYFQHSHGTTFSSLDGWVRMRLRSILRRRQGRKGRGRGLDPQRWPTTFFAERGLFSLVMAQVLACQSSSR
jgi:RNA-directed DNA polymerase